MSVAEEIAHLTDYADLVRDGIKLIRAAIGAILPDHHSAAREDLVAALTTIEAIVATIENIGDLPPADLATAKANLAKLKSVLADNDAAADAAVKAKFDHSEDDH